MVARPIGESYEHVRSGSADFIRGNSLLEPVSWDLRLDTTYHARVRRRHLRALASLVLLPVGFAVLQLLPWPRGANEALWIGLYLVFGLGIVVPAAYRLWDGENEPDSLPPGPMER
jgi:hypothetical protein